VSEARTLKQDDEKRLQAFDMKAQCHILRLAWYDFITSDSFREQTKLVDLLLVILADHIHDILGHIIHLLKKHQLIPCYSTLSTPQTEVTLQQAGSVHQVDHGKMATTSHRRSGL